MRSAITVLCCFCLGFMGHVSWAELTDEDVKELNEVFGQHHSKSEYENLKRLQLQSLPERQFPSGFDKLDKLEIIDLLPASSYVACVETAPNSMWGRSVENEKFLQQFGGTQICLSGRRFTLKQRQGSGKMAVVYQIENPLNAQVYAFTRWNSANGSEYKGSFLVLSRARKSKSRINLPLLLNKKERYSITPLMTGGEARESRELDKFRAKGDCELLMREDGIFSAFDFHQANYMYPTPESTRLKAIDFRAFKRLEDATQEQLSPRYSRSAGDPRKCEVD